MSERAGEPNFVGTHPEPIWRDKANYIIGGWIEKPVEYEQLWAKRRDDGLFEICCIPFYVRNLSLGDIVKVDSEDFIQKVLTKSKNIIFRVLFNTKYSDVIDIVLGEASKNNILHEKNSEHFFSFSANSETSAQEFSNFLENLEKAGRIEYETGAD